ncbi:hypothetical protein VCSRO193_2857 [Vibrio cholerae]|nr:hypothetical protein VCSRO193_2857 [Vibrio cholerae]
MKKKFLSVGFALIFTSPLTFSANYAIEARGDAMGGVGVVSGNFLTGPFYVNVHQYRIDSKKV